MINPYLYFQSICGRLDWDFASYAEDLNQVLENTDENENRTVLGIKNEFFIYNKSFPEESFPTRIEMPSAASGDTRYQTFNLLIAAYLSEETEMASSLQDLSSQLRDYLFQETRVLLGTTRVKISEKKVFYEIMCYIPLNNSFGV